ncbi:hypothetical protein [Nonomuraea sp. NPDC048826]|uniref:hypothetical protein n=1 Tax=Nonomuraea sp. NPDC048826 TaxID=3364347 RepID=UPI00371C0605
MSTGMSTRLLAGAAALTLAMTGCSASPAANDPNRLHRPQNDGANGDVQGVHVLNAFLLGPAPTGSPTSSPTGSPTGSSGGQPLYAVLINERTDADQLERVTVEGGGTVQLAGPVELRPNEAGSRPDQPIGMVSGVRGSQVPMTFTFREAGELRLTVPVLPKQGAYATLPASPSGTPSPTSSPSPTQSGPTPKPTPPPEHATRSPG